MANEKNYNTIGNPAPNKDPVASESQFLSPPLWSKLDLQVQIRATSMIMTLKSQRTGTEEENNLVLLNETPRNTMLRRVVTVSQSAHLQCGA